MPAMRGINDCIFMYWLIYILVTNYVAVTIKCQDDVTISYCL